MKMAMCVVLLLLGCISERADAYTDCNSKCCTKIFGAKVCEPTCLAACAVITIPEDGPLQVPTVPGLPAVKVDKDVAATLLTGGMVSPATRNLTNDTIREVGKALSNIGDEAERLGKNTEAELKRAGRDVGDAADAVGAYLEEKTKKTLEVPQNTLDRVREGKIVDAVWYAATADIQIEDEAASKAALKSDLIRTVGQVAATVYGGPQGAAAYSAWLTYHQTGGDWDLALKVGVITGATAYAMQGVNQMPTTNASGEIVASELAKKAAVTGAIGGLAVAAAGGDESAVKAAFLQAGAMVLIQEGYREYTKASLDEEALKSSSGDPYCISDVVNCQRPPESAAVYDKEGKFIGWDKSKLDRTAPHVGTGLPNQNIELAGVASEASPFMKGVSKVPGMNAMAFFHDQWAINWNMPPGVLQATIYPAIVMTYNGTSAPLFEEIRVAAAGSQVGKEDLAGATSVVVVRKDKVPQSVPVEQERVETTYLCAKDGESRSIMVEVGRPNDSFACRVLYRSDGVREVPWAAKHEADFCESKAKSLANQHLKWGFACVVGEATPRIVSE